MKALVAIYGGGLAGGGTFVQVKEGYDGLCEAARRLDRRLLTIWQEREHLATPDLAFEFTADTNAGRHVEARALADRVMADLKKDGCTHALIYSYGYTSFMLHAFSRYAADGEATVVWGDCSPPDSDIMGTDTTSRFYLDAYKNTHGILYGWHESMARSRVPEGLASYQLTAQPLGETYKKLVRKIGALSTAEARDRLSEFLPLQRDDLVVFFGSSNVWDEKFVGAWMTRKQWLGCVKSTINLYSALDDLGGQLGRKVKLLTHPTSMHLLDAGLDNLELIPASLPFREGFGLLKGRVADFVVNRASHAVTSAECAAMGVPQVILPIPAYNYMNVDEFTADIARDRLALVPTNDSRSAILASLASAADPAVAAATADRAAAEFTRVDTDFNFFDTLCRLGS